MDYVLFVSVSKDKIAENIALTNHAQVVISASGFLHLLDNHPTNVGKSWNLPIVIKETSVGKYLHWWWVNTIFYLLLTFSLNVSIFVIMGSDFLDSIYTYILVNFSLKLT